MSSSNNTSEEKCTFLFNTNALSNANDHYLSTSVSQNVPGLNPALKNQIKNKSESVHEHALKGATYEVQPSAAQNALDSAKKRKRDKVISLCSSSSEDDDQALVDKAIRKAEKQEKKKQRALKHEKKSGNKRQKTGDDTDADMTDNTVPLLDPKSIPITDEDQHLLLNVEGDLEGNDFVNLIQNNNNLVSISNDDLNGLESLSAIGNNLDGLSTLNDNDSFKPIVGSDEFASLLDNVWTPAEPENQISSNYLGKNPRLSTKATNQGGKDTMDDIVDELEYYSGDESDAVGRLMIANKRRAEEEHKQKMGFNKIETTLKCKLCLGTGHTKAACRYNVDYFPCSVCGVPGHAVHDNCPGRYCHQCLTKHHIQQPCQKPVYTITENDFLTDPPSAINAYLNIYAQKAQERENGGANMKPNPAFGKFRQQKQIAKASAQPFSGPQKLTTEEYQTLVTPVVCLHCGSSQHNSSNCQFEVDLPHCIPKKKSDKKNSHFNADRLKDPKQLEEEQKQKDLIKSVLSHTLCAVCGMYGHSYCDPRINFSSTTATTPSKKKKTKTPAVTTFTQDETGNTKEIENSNNNNTDDQQTSSTTMKDETTTTTTDNTTTTTNPLSNETLHIAESYIPVIRSGAGDYRLQCGLCGQINHLPNECNLVLRPQNPTMSDFGRKVVAGGNLTSNTRIFNIYNEELTLITSRIVKNGLACTSCNRQGHKFFECPNRKCFLCNQTGHDKAECPERKQRGNNYGGYGGHGGGGYVEKRSNGGGSGGYKSNNYGGGDRRHSYGEKRNSYGGNGGGGYKGGRNSRR